MYNIIFFKDIINAKNPSTCQGEDFCSFMERKKEDR